MILLPKVALRHRYRVALPMTAPQSNTSRVEYDDSLSAIHARLTKLNGNVRLGPRIAAIEWVSRGLPK
jgi:hypothetical protein